MGVPETVDITAISTEADRSPSDGRITQYIEGAKTLALHVSLMLDEGEVYQIMDAVLARSEVSRDIILISVKKCNDSDKPVLIRTFFPEMETGWIISAYFR